MNDLRRQLDQILSGRVCLVGLGNPEHGDDGFGVRLAQEYSTAVASLAANPDETHAFVLMGGTQPESPMSRLPKDLDHVVFLDAVDFGGAPGAVILLGSTEMRSRYPQISTHRLSLGLLAQLVECGTRTRAWLLGVQPESLKEGTTLSAPVEETLGLLCQLLTECVSPMSMEEQIA